MLVVPTGATSSPARRLQKRLLLILCFDWLFFVFVVVVVFLVANNC